MFTQMPREELEANALGLAKSDARFKRKSARLAEELGNCLAKNSGLRHEVKSLEDLLVWVHNTDQPLEVIRHTIERRISRRLSSRKLS